MITNRKYIFTTLILLFQFTWSFSQTLSLTDAVNIAVNENLSIKSAQQHYRVIAQNGKIANRNYVPSVSLLGGYTHLSNSLELDMSQVKTSVIEGMSTQNVSTLNDVNIQLTGAPLSSAAQQTIYDNTYSSLDALYPDWNARLSEQNYFTANLVINQPIFLSGSFVNAGKIASSTTEIAKLTTSKKIDNTKQKVINVYFQALLLQQIKANQLTSLNAIQKHLSNANKLVEQGMLASYQVYEIQSAVNKSEALNKTAEANYELELSKLKTLLNLPADTQIVLSTQIPSFDLMLPLNDLQQNAIDYSHLSKINAESEKIAKYSYNSSKADFLPSLFAVGEFQLYQKNLPVTTPPWMVGVQLKWDLFNGSRSFARLKSNKLVLEKSQLDNEIIIEDIKLIIRQLYTEAQNNYELYLAQKKSVLLIQKTLTATQKEFSAGRVRSVDVLDTQARYDAGLIIESTYLVSYYLALTELNKLTGNLANYIQNIDKDEEN